MFNVTFNGVNYSLALAPANPPPGMAQLAGAPLWGVADGIAGAAINHALDFGFEPGSPRDHERQIAMAIKGGRILVFT